MTMLAWLLWASIAPSAVGDVPPPDLSKGNIGGKKALIAYAVANIEDVEGPGARFDHILPTRGCEVHLAPFDDLEHELVYPCGTWFMPAEGRYRVWLEASGGITPGFGRLTWDLEPFDGRGISLAMGLEPAGRVALAKPVMLPGTASFRLVHLRASFGGKLRRLFDRRATAELARKGVPILAGPVLAGIFDRKTGDAIALARPLEVRADATVFAEPTPPVRGSDVLVILTRPRDAKPGQEEVAIHLDVDGTRKAPDAIVAAAERVVAVWYAVEGRKAVVRAGSKTLRLPQAEIALRPRSVTTFRGELALLPSVAVSIHGPEEVLRDAEMRAELRLRESTGAARTIDVRPNGEYRFDAVPAEPVDVALIVGPWEFVRSVNLSAGADETVVFDLVPIVLSGTVFHGRDPTPRAEVAFKADRDWIRTISDDAGRYESIVWRRDGYIAEVTLPHGGELPFVDGPFEVDGHRIIDFHVPRTRFEVNVRDASTGRAIAGARISAASAYDRSSAAHNVVQTAMTNADGVAALPPMRAGTMVLRVRAEGYFDSEPMRRVVQRIDEEDRFDIALRPVGETIRVTVRAAAGYPAEGAQVWAVHTASGQQPPLWRGNADRDGVVEIPRRLQGALFLVRAEHSASAVRRLTHGDRDLVWTLEPPAGSLNVRIAKKTRIAVWIDGERVSGAPLAFLSHSVDATDRDGMWSAALLPRRPLRMLAWRSASSEASVAAGAFDGVATIVEYPWPRVVELQPVD